MYRAAMATRHSLLATLKRLPLPLHALTQCQNWQDKLKKQQDDERGGYRRYGAPASQAYNREADEHTIS